MIVETTCRRCGKTFIPDRRAIAAGPAVWRLCPRCREDAPESRETGRSAPKPRRPRSPHKIASLISITARLTVSRARNPPRSFLLG